jgi:hypothetical protein
MMRIFIGWYRMSLTTFCLVDIMILSGLHIYAKHPWTNVSTCIFMSYACKKGLTSLKKRMSGILSVRMTLKCQGIKRPWTSYIQVSRSSQYLFTFFFLYFYNKNPWLPMLCVSKTGLFYCSCHVSIVNQVSLC